MGCSVGQLSRSNQGAVAPTVALSLFALIAAGGIAFDYARLASMDTELQQAADHAALAAASQLDGTAGACARAAAAAQNLLLNTTLFANDGDAAAILVAEESECDADGDVRFYKTYDEVNDTPGEAAASDAEAKFVEIAVTPRESFYALTPVVGALSSGAHTARAIATLGAGAICKIPPLMICNPNEASGGIFPNAADIGKGLKLEAGGGGTWAPGNYGYLDFGSGASTLERAIGANVNAEPCVSADEVMTKPGNTASAPAGINTRFDIFENGLVAYCAQSTGNCSPALNVTKDIIHTIFTGTNEMAKTTNPPDNCSFATGNGPWVLPTMRYVPGGPVPQSMGLPRDICHAGSKNGICGGATTQSRFGDGNWDRLSYFLVNHPSGSPASGVTAFAEAATWAGKLVAATTGPTSLTRYDVYKWELDKWAATPSLARRRLAELRVRLNPQGKPTGQTDSFYSYTSARCAAGQGATEEIKDRRLLTAAVVNCTAGGVQGASAIDPLGWVDMLLTEPSLNRKDNGGNDLTGQDQIYVEVVGVATRPDGNSNTFQYFLKQRPRLVQ